MLPPRLLVSISALLLAPCLSTVGAQAAAPDLPIHVQTGCGDCKTVETTTASLLLLATFTDDDPLGRLTDFTATVALHTTDANNNHQLGCSNSTTSCWIRFDAARHLYFVEMRYTLEAGTNSATVTVIDAGGSSGSVIDTWTVHEEQASPQAATPAGRLAQTGQPSRGPAPIIPLLLIAGIGMLVADGRLAPAVRSRSSR